MAELKTQPTDADVLAYIARLDDQQRADSKRLIAMMQRITNDSPTMWGSSIIGFGKRHLKYESGRELDWMKIGFAARKGTMTIYCPVALDEHVKTLDEIGKYKIGKGCLYIKKLADVDTAKLEAFLKSTV